VQLWTADHLREQGEQAEDGETCDRLPVKHTEDQNNITGCSVR